jgi:serine-type D-Ala-D-Ala carboxypeptidase/endopeptidase
LSDLLALLRVNLHPDGSPLRASLLLARQSRAEGTNGAIGFGWNIHEVAMDEQTWPLVWRASETGGFSTFVGFRSDRQQGLVILANSATQVAPIGLAWLSDLSVPPPPPAPFVPDLTQVNRYPGLYRLLSGADVIVRADGTALTAQARGQPAWPLFAVAEDVYTSDGGAIGVTFVRNIDAISGLLLHANGEYISARRLSDRAPRLARNPIAVDTTTLATYAGDYSVDPEFLLRVVAVPEGIAVQYTGHAPIPMRAYARDRFADAGGGNGLIFRRDEQARITSVTIELAGGERTAAPAHWQAVKIAMPSSP